MTRIATIVALFGPLIGCVGRHPIQQTTLTQLREQDALVMAPEVPMGFGAALPLGGSSLSLGGGFARVQALEGTDIGQKVLPLSGLLRGAASASDGVEVTASGSFASPDVEMGPYAQGVDYLHGVLGRGTLGMRMFVPLASPVEWGWSLDLGAEATHLIRTDTDTLSVRNRNGFETSQDESSHYRIRTLPHVRMATLVNVPFPAGLSAMGGMQLQTWPVYWASREETQTCTSYDTGETECSTTGNVDGAPSKLVGVFTPTIGATLKSGTLALHAQGFVNLGTEAVEQVPWGAMLVLEHVIEGKGEKEVSE